MFAPRNQTGGHQFIQCGPDTVVVCKLTRPVVVVAARNFREQEIFAFVYVVGPVAYAAGPEYVYCILVGTAQAKVSNQAILRSIARTV